MLSSVSSLLGNGTANSNLYVAGLPPSTSEEMMRQLFKEFGDVTRPLMRWRYKNCMQNSSFWAMGNHKKNWKSLSEGVNFWSQPITATTATTHNYPKTSFVQVCKLVLFVQRHIGLDPKMIRAGVHTWGVLPFRSLSFQTLKSSIQEQVKPGIESHWVPSTSTLMFSKVHLVWNILEYFPMIPTDDNTIFRVVETTRIWGSCDVDPGDPGSPRIASNQLPGGFCANLLWQDAYVAKLWFREIPQRFSGEILKGPRWRFVGD